jgi:hypothetical protein
MRKGDRWLKSTLIQCAWAAARTKGGDLGSRAKAELTALIGEAFIGWLFPR